jgi:hypothetical protein
MRAAMACAEVGDETHLDVDDAGIERAASVLTGLLR